MSKLKKYRFYFPEYGQKESDAGSVGVRRETLYELVDYLSEHSPEAWMDNHDHNTVVMVSTDDGPFVKMHWFSEVHVQHHIQEVHSSV